LALFALFTLLGLTLVTKRGRSSLARPDAPQLSGLAWHGWP